VIGTGCPCIDIMFFRKNAFNATKGKVSSNSGTGDSPTDNKYLCFQLNFLKYYKN
jgi:hypothetical protein